jgi:uncharacterized membrane protein
MNAAYVHLTLNHVPILGVVFALPLLGFGLLRRNPTLVRAGWVTLVVVALVAIPVYLSGEGAEEIVEDLPGVSHDAIEAHEEIALFGLIGALTLGVLALAGLLLSRRSAGVPTWLPPASFVLALAVAGLMTAVAYRGGLINHPEAHDGAAPQEGGEDGEDEDGRGRGRGRGRH